MAGKRKWIQSAIKRPGALRAKAKAAGALTKAGDISSTWLRKVAKEKGRTGRQARLALTLKRLSRGKKKG